MSRFQKEKECRILICRILFCSLFKGKVGYFSCLCIPDGDNSRYVSERKLQRSCCFGKFPYEMGGVQGRCSKSSPWGCKSQFLLLNRHFLDEHDYGLVSRQGGLNLFKIFFIPWRLTYLSNRCCYQEINCTFHLALPFLNQNYEQRSHKACIG